LKKVQKLPAARNSDRVLKLKQEKVREWESAPDLGFTRNCVFIDEAGYNLHKQSNYGRSRKRTPAKGTIPTVKGITITIFGSYISS
jgi:hypothetical protein